MGGNGTDISLKEYMQEQFDKQDKRFDSFDEKLDRLTDVVTQLIAWKNRVEGIFFTLKIVLGSGFVVALVSGIVYIFKALTTK